LRQVQLDQKTMIGGDATVQGFVELYARRFQAVVRSVKCAGSVSPALSTRRMARPLVPGMSVTTRVNFRVASCCCRRFDR
jgi:hypothetical protein